MKIMLFIGMVLVATGVLMITHAATIKIANEEIASKPNEVIDPYVIFDSIFVDLNHGYNKSQKGLHYRLRETETDYCVDVMIDDMITFSYDWFLKKNLIDKMAFENLFNSLLKQEINDMVAYNCREIKHCIDLPIDVSERVKKLNRHRATKMIILLDENGKRPSTTNPSIYYSSDTVTLNLSLNTQSVYSFKKFEKIYPITSELYYLKKDGKTPTKLILSEKDRLVINDYGNIKTIYILGIECVVEDGEKTEFICE